MNTWKYPALIIGTIAVTGISWGQVRPPNSAADQTTGVVVLLQSISGELRRIHLRLLADRREIQRAKVQGFERELETIQDQECQIQAEQNSLSQQATDNDNQLLKPELSKAEREELETQKAELLATPPSHFSSPQNALAQREARIRDGLAVEEQRVQELEQQLRQLSAGTR